MIIIENAINSIDKSIKEFVSKKPKKDRTEEDKDFLLGLFDAKSILLEQKDK